MDAVVLHARFFEEKFKRRARHELFPWAASLTRLPLIANGDLNGPEAIRCRASDFQPVCGVMLGRMAIVQPWIFAHWNQRGPVDLGISGAHAGYVIEDFRRRRGARMLIFTKYFAANFNSATIQSRTGERSPSRNCATREDFFGRARR